MDREEFKHRVAVVTGGARGIGAAIAREIAARGAVVVLADLDEEAADLTSREIGDNAHSDCVDVSVSSSVRALLERTVAQHGRLDIWVNNAGIADDGPSLELDDARWSKVLEVNLNGTFFGAREAGRHFMAAGGGVIVNVASIAAFRASRPERHLAYDVSKAGVAHMTRVLAAEWALANIRVNAVAPGYTETEILRAVGHANPETVQEWMRRIPQQRFIQPHEIASTVAFLASDAASAVTGHVLLADAGFTAL